MLIENDRKGESAACASHVEVPKTTGSNSQPRRTDNVGQCGQR